MDLSAGGELPLHLGATSRRLARRRDRCANTAKLFLLGGFLGLAALCLLGMQPAAVAIPLFLMTLAALFGAASAGLFARVASFELGAGPPDDEDYGSPKVDWTQFERDFRAYCARVRTS